MDHLSEYMRGCCEAENQIPAENTLVQTDRGKDLFLFSELLQFYLEMGYEVRNVWLVVQYLGERCLGPPLSRNLRKCGSMQLEKVMKLGQTPSRSWAIALTENSSLPSILRPDLWAKRRLEQWPKTALTILLCVGNGKW